MSRVVLGIDGSYTRTGCGIWVDGRVSTWSIETSKKDTHPQRRAQIIRESLGRLGQIDKSWPWRGGQGTLIMIEAVHLLHGKQLGRVPLDLAMLFGAIVDAAHWRGIPVAAPEPSQVKSFATGKGNASKDAMVMAARADLGIVPANHDEADGAWLTAMGVYRHGGEFPHAAAPPADRLADIYDWKGWPSEPSLGWLAA